VQWPVTFEAGGAVRAALTASIASRIVAPVLAVHVNAGDRVRRGQPLVTLDARELNANAERARASAAAAEESIASADANQAAADAALALARATHDRIRRLHDTRSATPQELDAAVAGLSGASAQVTAARAQAAGARAGFDAAQAGRSAAQVAVSYAVLTAPFDGVVASRSADPGALAAPGLTLLTIESAGGYEFQAQVDESRRGGLRPGDRADILIDVPGEAASWTASRISEIGSIDPQQHSFLVTITLAPRDGLHAGAFGRVRLFGAPRPTLATAASALVRRGQLWMAFTLDGEGVARLRALSPGETRDNQVEILAGLAPGDRVVLSPPAALQDGARVRTRAAVFPTSGAGR
jgi:RND family efflux transporter MFP subunit